MLKRKLDTAVLVNISSLAELGHKVPEISRLLMEWHPKRNQNLPPYGVNLTPESVTPLDLRRVWWRCKKGHSWQESVSDRVKKMLAGRPGGCPFCTPEKVKRKERLWDYCISEMPEGEVDCAHLLDEWDDKKNAPLTPKDVKTVEYRKVWWKCDKGHSWQALISNRVKAGAGCPYCGHRKVLAGFNDLETLYPDIAKEWDYEKNRRKPAEVMAMSSRKVWWRCPEGHSYEKIVSNRTQQGQGCPVCRALRGEKGSMLIRGVNDLSTTDPEVAAEWNQERNDGLRPSDVKAGSRKVVWWKCAQGHEWQAPVARRTGCRRSGCPQCRRERGGLAKRSE